MELSGVPVQSSSFWYVTPSWRPTDLGFGRKNSSRTSKNMINPYLPCSLVCIQIFYTYASQVFPVFSSFQELAYSELERSNLATLHEQTHTNLQKHKRRICHLDLSRRLHTAALTSIESRRTFPVPAAVEGAQVASV